MALPWSGVHMACFIELAMAFELGVATEGLLSPATTAAQRKSIICDSMKRLLS